MIFEFWFFDFTCMFKKLKLTLYTLKIQNFWKTFLTIVSIQIWHNNMNLAKTISKIRKWRYTLMHTYYLDPPIKQFVNIFRFCPTPIFKHI